MKNKKSKAKDYQKHLIESLRDPTEAVEYLNASLEEAGDMPELFLVAGRAGAVPLRERQSNCLKFTRS